MTERVRIVVVGVGRMGRIHARTMSGLDEVELVGVSDARADTAQEVAGELGVESIGLRDLAGRNDIAGWVVATPTTTHPAVVHEALAGGRHVLCEKPLSLDVESSRRLGETAAGRGLTLQLGFWRRFSPPWTAAKQLIDAGAIGRPLMLRLSQWDANPPPPAFCDPSVSGGLAIDCGVHEFDLAEWLTGLPVEAVSGWNLPIADEGVRAAGDVDNLVATLHLAGGTVGVVDLSRNCRYADDVRTEILGEDGAIFIEMVPAGRTRLATRSGIEVVVGSEVDDPFLVGVAEESRVFVRLIRGEHVDHPGAQASTRALAIGRAVQSAAEAQTTVPIAV